VLHAFSIREADPAEVLVALGALHLGAATFDLLDLDPTLLVGAVLGTHLQEKLR